VLRALAAAQPRGLLLRMAGACDWRLDAGGALLAPTLGGALEHWARTVILARPLPSGFSREAHGRLELVRRSGGSGAGMNKIINRFFSALNGVALVIEQVFNLLQNIDILWTIKPAATIAFQWLDLRKFCFPKTFHEF
jgi:hypothetical protein